MEIFFLFIINLIIISIKCFKTLPRLNRKQILTIEKNKESVALIYINSKNISHNIFMEEVSNYIQINPLNKYNYGYLDVISDKKMLEYFKIKNLDDSGIIIFKFENKNYYIGEGIHHLNEIKDIFEKIQKNKLNWSSNSIIETLFFLVTGKRYGKEAHSMFSFGICVFSLLLYLFVGIKSGREEREMIEKKIKGN